MTSEANLCGECYAFKQTAVPGGIKARLLKLACGALHNLTSVLLTSLISVKDINFSFPALLYYFLPLQILFPLSGMVASSPLFVSLGPTQHHLPSMDLALL